MIEGYNGLNENISQTIQLISDVETASKEQQTGIIQINDAVNNLDQQTQQNANIASQTHQVAVKTDEIAKLVVYDANEKEFIGKDNVKAKDIGSSNNVATSSTPTQKAHSQLIEKQVATTNSTPNNNIQPITSNTSDDEWASF